MELTEHRESELALQALSLNKAKRKNCAKYVQGAGRVLVCVSSVLESSSWVLCPSEAELLGIFCGAGGVVCDM